MTTHKKPWLTISEVAREADVEVEVMHTNIRSGLFDAWARLEGGMLKFRPDTVRFVGTPASLGSRIN